MLPCNHNPPRLPPAGAPYTTAFCRLCWLYHHDPAYRALWDQPPAAGPRTRPCRHRGAALREEPCPSCQGQVRVKVFACAAHQHCTVARAVAGCACCGTCADCVPTADDPGPPPPDPATAASS